MRFVLYCTLIRRSLSSTCKPLAEVCVTALFHSVRLDDIDSEHRQQLVDTVDEVGPFINDLTLVVNECTDDEEEQPTHQIFPRVFIPVRGLSLRRSVPGRLLSYQSS